MKEESDPKLNPKLELLKDVRTKYLLATQYRSPELRINIKTVMDKCWASDICQALAAGVKMVLRDIFFIKGYARLPRKKSPTKDKSTKENFKAHKKISNCTI